MPHVLRLAVVFLGLVVVVGVGGFLGAVAEDFDAGFAFAYLAAFGLPLPESGDHGGVRVLGEDEQQVVQAVLVEGSGEVQELFPPPAYRQLLDLFQDGGV